MMVAMEKARGLFGGTVLIVQEMSPPYLIALTSTCNVPTILFMIDVITEWIWGFFAQVCNHVIYYHMMH